MPMDIDQDKIDQAVLRYISDPVEKAKEELAAQSHCLSLSTNLVMAYNTSHLQQTLLQPRGEIAAEFGAHPNMLSLVQTFNESRMSVYRVEG